jgi:hypothetical protein
MLNRSRTGELKSYMEGIGSFAFPSITWKFEVYRWINGNSTAVPKILAFIVRISNRSRCACSAPGILQYGPIPVAANWNFKGGITLTVGFEVRTAVIVERSVFWDITSWSPSKVNRRFGGTRHLLKTEAVWSSERSVDFRRATRRYIPEGKTLSKIYRVEVCSFETLVPTYQATRCRMPEDRNMNLHGRENFRFRVGGLWG